MRGEVCIEANGLATLVATWVRALTTARRGREAAREPPASRMWSTCVVLGRGEEELQRARALPATSVLHERLQHVGLVVVRQAARALGGLGLLGRHVEARWMSWVSWLPPNAWSRVENGLVVAQHVEVRDVGADVDQRDVLVAAVRRQRRRDQAERLLRARRTRRPSPAALRPADSATATRSSTFSLREAAIRTSTLFRVVRRRAERLEVEVDLVERERDVLVGLGLDLQLEVFLPLAGRAR